MKKTVLSAIMALIATASLFANEPNPLQFELTNPSRTVTMSDISSSYTLDEPILGWHWGGCRLMTEAMEMNQTATSGFGYPVGMPEAGSFGCNRYLVYVLYSKSFVFNFIHF